MKSWALSQLFILQVGKLRPGEVTCPFTHAESAQSWDGGRYRGGTVNQVSAAPSKGSREGRWNVGRATSSPAAGAVRVLFLVNFFRS